MAWPPESQLPPDIEEDKLHPTKDEHRWEAGEEAVGLPFGLGGRLPQCRVHQIDGFAMVNVVR